MEDLILYAANTKTGETIQLSATVKPRKTTRKSAKRKSPDRKPQVIHVDVEYVVRPPFVVEAKAAWNGANYGGGWGYPGIGIVVVTGNTFVEFKKKFKKALYTLLRQMIKNGEPVPEWAISGNFTITYDLF